MLAQLIVMQALTVRKIETEATMETKTLFWLLFAGTRGANSRIKIITYLKNTPANKNQMAEDLGMDYKSIQHHVRILMDNGLITKIGDRYGRLYFVSEKFESGKLVFEEIVNKLESLGRI